MTRPQENGSLNFIRERKYIKTTGNRSQNMKNVKELYTLLKGNKGFEKKYPQYMQNDGKIHILYIAPCLNGTGFYRMIAPMLELNTTSTHCAIITKIHKWNFTKSFEDYDNPIDERLIRWADYIVLPMTYSDVGYILDSIRGRSRDIQFVMDMDRFPEAYPKEHLDNSKVTGQHKDMLLRNISRMDLLTASTPGIIKNYKRLIQAYHPSSKVCWEYLPDHITNFGFGKVARARQDNGPDIRIGIIASASAYYDTLAIKEVLLGVKKKYGERVTLVLLGWNGKLLGKELMQGLDFIFERSVSFLDYYEKLHDLSLDMALLPLKKCALQYRRQIAHQVFGTIVPCHSRCGQ